MIKAIRWYKMIQQQTELKKLQKLPSTFIQCITFKFIKTIFALCNFSGT